MAARPETTGRKPPGVGHNSSKFGVVLADDLLEGVSQIAAFTGFKPRRVFYLAENGKLPLFKVGNRWCGRRSTLIDHIARLEAGEAA
jgi:hypothetical protein